MEISEKKVCHYDLYCLILLLLNLNKSFSFELLSVICVHIFGGQNLKLNI